MAENPYAAPSAQVGDADDVSDAVWIASRTQRFFTLVIDYVCYLIFGGAFGLILGFSGFGRVFTHMGALQRNFMGLCIIVAFYLIFEGALGRTPGKWICGTRVVDLDGERPGLGRVLGRTLARFVPFEPFSFFSSHAIGWHDSWSGTRVVRTRGTGTLQLSDSNE